MPSLKPLEELASDGGAAVNTLAGWLSRTLFRVKRLETAQARLIERLSALEESAPHRPPGNGWDTRQTGK
jgi:hypothetical protein